MNDPRPTHPPRVKFDTLFTDPRHYRGDARLARTAIRRGWLNDAPQADRDALIERLHAAMIELGEPDAGTTRTGRRIMAQLGVIGAIVDASGASQTAALRIHRYFSVGTPTVASGILTGRPRERWHVSDRPNRIDANAVRRQAKAEGWDPRDLSTINVRPANAPAAAGERVILAVGSVPVGGWRVWLICPGCGQRRTHLYPTGAGVRCRRCARLGYGTAG